MAEFPKIDWMLLVIVTISVLSLYQVHYNYTGKFSMANDQLFQYHEAENMRYVYPYFSDEWYAIALLKNPLINPFNGQFFINPELFFHSFLAIIMFVFRMNPLTQYTLLSIFFNALIILLAYLFLRVSNLSKAVSAISALSILYITSSANLPGIWNLIPMTTGVVFSLAGFCFLPKNSFKIGLLAGFFAFLFYPPLIVFYGCALAAYFLQSKTKENLPAITKHLLIAGSILAALLIILILFPVAKIAEYIFSNLFYNSFTGDFIPVFNPFYIIPWWAIIFAAPGLVHVFKNQRWLFFQLALGAAFWVAYMFSVHRLIIGFERVVYFTSILVVLVSGFGIEEVKKYLILKFSNNGKTVLKFTEIGAVILFFVFIPFYTQGENWRKLILRNPRIQADSIPMAPANNYLTQEDLRIFKNIKHKNFFSIPWKGTVIGIATDNYPTLTKGGTITMGAENPTMYQQFMEFSCQEKIQFAKDKNLDYVYSMPFFCPEFEKIDQSSEGFILYNVKEK